MYVLQLILHINNYVGLPSSPHKMLCVNVVGNKLYNNQLTIPLSQVLCNKYMQLSAYLMAKYQAFAEEHDGEPNFQIAAKYLGLQNIEDEQKIWVFNKDLQLTEDGEEIVLSTSNYIWLGDFAAKCKGLGNYSVVNHSLAAKIAGPMLKKRALRRLKVTYENNFPAALLTLGAQIMCTHYETLNKTGGFNVPATILHGDMSHTVNH